MSVALRCCFINSFVAVGLLFSWEQLLCTFSLSSWEFQRHFSFMPHVVGREITGFIVDTMDTYLPAVFLYQPVVSAQDSTTLTTLYTKLTYIHTYTCVCTFLPVLFSQHKTAPHVIQHFARKLQTYIHTRACARNRTFL